LLISQLTIEFVVAVVAVLRLSVHLGLDIKETVQVVRNLKP
jgi:hypothetical protein